MDLHILCTAHNFNVSTIEHYKQSDWIGVDYGAVILMNHGITPIAAFGDFDSTSVEEFNQLSKLIEVDRLPSEKDETDLEVAVKFAVTGDYKNVYIHGATGGRMDHFLGNLQLLLNHDVLMSSSDFYIVDNQNVIQVLSTGTHVIEHWSGMAYVSFIPVQDEVILSISGLKYELDRAILELGKTRTVSNEFVTKRAEVSVKNGLLIMVQSKE